MAEEIWYYADAGAQHGPVSWEQLRQFVADGLIRSDTLVWKPSMANWAAAGAVDGLLSAWPAASPAAPPPVMTGQLSYSNPLIEERLNPFVPAGFWLRFVALILDLLISYAPVAVFGLLLLTPVPVYLPGTPARPPPPSMIFHSCMSPLLNMIIPWLYFSLMESSELQATVGKMAMGIKVMDLGGRRISFGRATGRYFAKWLSYFLFCIGFIMAVFTQRKQALHDMLANTLVVKREIVVGGSGLKR